MAQRRIARTILALLTLSLAACGSAEKPDRFARRAALFKECLALSGGIRLQRPVDETDLDDVVFECGRQAKSIDWGI